jgi:hypothetical protein
MDNKWSLLSLQAEQVNPNLNHTSTLHNLTDNTFNAVNVNITTASECQTIADLHTKYLQNIKVDRWLYRYSLLHRHSLHKAHDLTLTKRLTSLGLFSGNLTSNNLWASNFINITPDLRTTLTNLYKQTYGDIWSQSGVVQTPLTDIEFFESSYFWVLKRFYNLNTLDRNCVISSLTPNTNNGVAKYENNFNFYKATDLPIRLNLNELTVFSSLQPKTTLGLNTVSKSSKGTLDLTSTHPCYHVLAGEVVVIARAISNDKLAPNSRHLFFNSNSYTSPTSTQLVWASVNSTNSLSPTVNVAKLLPLR